MIKGKFILPLGGAGGKTAEFRVSEGWLQWRYADQTPEDTWTGLIEIPSDGKSPEMRYFEGWFQWRYADQSPADTWKNLVELSLDGDITINEYGYWQLTIEPSADELDADADVAPETMQIGSMEQLSMQGDGTVRLILDSITRRLTIVGATIEFTVDAGWLYYRYVYDSTAMDADEGWIPIMEIIYAADTDADTSVEGTTITGFAASVAEGTVPTVGDLDKIRIRITESNATTHDIYLGGHAALREWHGDEINLPGTRDSDVIYYVNEPTV